MLMAIWLVFPLHTRDFKISEDAGPFHFSWLHFFKVQKGETPFSIHSLLMLALWKHDISQLCHEKVLYGKMIRS